MPAVVLDVMVAPGEEVAAGQGLCVIEAMKMENLMRAPRAGVVKEVKIEKGRGVALGDVLVVIE
jgi:acetyl-CoA/propionyl-CoA carboxylase biotin carboxyl carrier protein